MTRNNLIKRLKYWEKTLKLVEQFQQGYLYKLTFDKWYQILIPNKFTLSGMTFHFVASSQSYLGMKLSPNKTMYTFGYMSLNVKKIERLKKSDLPLYLNERYVNHTIVEKILKGKKKIKEK